MMQPTTLPTLFSFLSTVFPLIPKSDNHHKLESQRKRIFLKGNHLERNVMAMRRKLSEIENRRAELKGGEKKKAVA